MSRKFVKLVQRRWGFTLLETLLVVVIAGALLSFAVVSSGAIRRQKLGIAASMIAEDIRLTQQMNLNQDGAYTLVFECSADRYFIARDEGVSVYKTVDLPAGIDLVSNNFASSRLGFDTRGSPRPRGGHLSISDGHGRYLYVIVQTITGRVRIDSEPP